MSDDRVAMRRRAGLRQERVRASAQHKDGLFQNPSGLGAGIQGNPLPVLGEFFFKRAGRRPPAPLPIERPHETWVRGVDSGLRVTWLGHSTVLLEIDGYRVLTDPVFAERVSPVTFAGPKRFHPVPAGIDELPPIDLVVLSHDHFDHLCASSMSAIGKKRIPVVTALGVGHWLERYGVDPALITELDWHDHVEIAGIRVTAQPCQHFSGRGLISRNRTLWASWVIESSRHKVFFSGDTGLTTDFEETGRRHGPFDLVMLEVGAYHPSWGTIHLGPENALEAFRMLGGGTFLPVHWGTFDLGIHVWDDPAETLYRLATERGARILTPKLGAVFEPVQVDGPVPWWREVVGVKERRCLPLVGRAREEAEG